MKWEQNIPVFGLNTLILNEGVLGGQMVLTNEIANYPGVEKTKGFVVANTMKKQAKDFGCKIKSNVKITGYRLDSDPKTVITMIKVSSYKDFISRLTGKEKAYLFRNYGQNC